MEGETNFLAMLPAQHRSTLLASWYQNAGPELTEFLEGDINNFEQATGINYESNKPQHELYDLLGAHLEEVQPTSSTFESDVLTTNELSQLAKINEVGAKQASIMPETTIIVVRDDNEPNNIDVFTVLRNSAHYNVNSLFDEQENRNPSEDTLTVVGGFLGSYPDAFWQINASQIESTVKQLSSIKSESDYQRLLDNVGVRRTNPNFWAFSDELILWSQQTYPIAGGLLDYNRLEDR